MKIVKIIIFSLLTVLAMGVLLFGIFMLINGSLEEFPTEEQIEKARISGALCTVIGAGFGCVLVIAI